MRQLDRLHDIAWKEQLNDDERTEDDAKRDIAKCCRQQHAARQPREQSNYPASEVRAHRSPTSHDMRLLRSSMILESYATMIGVLRITE